MTLEGAEAEGANHGAHAEGGEQDAVAAGGEPELVGRDERQQRPHRSGGEHEGDEPEQDGPDDWFVPHIAAAGPQRGQESFAVAPVGGRPAPQQQDDDQDGGQGGIQGEYRRHSPGGDDEAGDRWACGAGDVDADHVEPGRGGDLVAGDQFGDQ
jgi:hypothetical protein